MKLQEASRRELKRIAAGSVICLAAMLGVFFLLSMFQTVKFDYTVLLGGVIGTALAIGNFWLLCLTIQQAAQSGDEKQMKARFQLSYNARLVLQAAWIVAAYLLPWFHVIAAAVPLLFPRLLIYFFQKKGVLVQPSERKNPPQEEDREEESRLDSFEA